MKLHLQSGVSLIEFTLSCSLGFILIVGLLNIYLATKKNSDFQQAIVYIQNNAIFANEILKKSILNAGDARCLNSNNFADQNKMIKGYAGILPVYLKNKVKADTDTVVLGTCKMINGKEQFDEYAFFIGETSRKNKLGKPIFALFGQSSVGEKEELVSNISSMKIKYGILSSGTHDIEHYVTANEVEDWNRVYAVEIFLLLDSLLPIYYKPEKYYFYDKSYPQDRYLHRQWFFYSTLRNRL